MTQTPINEELIVRYFSGKITEEEQQALFSWIQENPENERQLFILKDIYDATARERLFEEAQTEKGWRKLQETIAQKKQQPQKAIVKRPVWTEHIRRYAAIFVLGALIGSSIIYLSDSHKDVVTADAKQCMIQTGKGERTTVTLPDGSVVKLNACSSLVYAANFGQTNRELQFTGEGYFDVQTNPDIPFTVKTSGLNIKAYGTVFNVKAYADEDLVETTLVEGIVNIEILENKKIVTLKPNQIITIPKALVESGREQDYVLTEIKPAKHEVAKNMPEKIAKPVLIDDIKTEVYTSWKDDKWIINAENLESLSKKIERKYDVTIDIRDDASKRYAFSGTLRNYPLEQVLDIIRLNAPIGYSVKEKTVTIKEDKQLKKEYDKLIQPNPDQHPSGILPREKQ